LRWVRRS